MKKSKKIIINDLESFFIDDILKQVKQRKKDMKEKKALNNKKSK